MRGGRKAEIGFGPVWQGDGVIFRLWAPKQRAVSLVLLDRHAATTRPMNPQKDGWFVLPVTDVPAGARYGFRLENGMTVPDPGSRFQPQGVEGLSAVIDPHSYRWQTREWRGRPWESAVISEIHVGAFSPEGSFDGVRRRLETLAECGFTAIRLMPVSSFPTAFDRGSHMVLPFAPSATYGRPDDLKALVDTAHHLGLMVILDVVYHRFCAHGNHIPEYAPDFFTTAAGHSEYRETNFASRPVREYVVQNALYWLTEFRVDGLQISGVEGIHDPGLEHILYEIRRRVGEGLPRGHLVHLILENEANNARYLDRDYAGAVAGFTAQQNEDVTNAFQAVLGAETNGADADFAQRPVGLLARCLAQGFAYQGEVSPTTGQPRGEASGGLPPAAFIHSFESAKSLGCRPDGQRISKRAGPEALRAALALLLLAPMPPQLFMGEEWGADEPFPLFSALPVPGSDGATAEIAGDLHACALFEAATLDWARRIEKDHAARLDFVRHLLGIRHRFLTPRLAGVKTPAISAHTIGTEEKGEMGFHLDWILNDNTRYMLCANLTGRRLGENARQTGGQPLFSTHPEQDQTGPVPALYVSWHFAVGAAAM